MGSGASALVVLFSALVATLVSALGALPYLRRDRVSSRWLGVAQSLASGCMLGVGFVLLAGETDAGWRPVLGAGIGVVLVFSIQRFFGFAESREEEETVRGYQLMLSSSVHAGMEGAAIGAAMLNRMSLGLFLAAALAFHNIAEGTALIQLLRERDVKLKDAAGLCVMVKLPQTLTALSVFAVISATPVLLPWGLGLAAGSLFYIILTDLLPGAYEHNTTKAVAVLTSVSAALVVLFEGVLG